MKLSDRTFMLKIRTLILVNNIKRAIKRHAHCRNGHHQVYSQSRQVSNSRGLRIRSSWVGCQNCEYLFFPSKHYKRNYKRMDDQWKSVMKNAGVSTK